MDHDELDDEWKPTKVHIPKVKEGIHQVAINVSDIRVNYKSIRTSVTLKKQVFDGFTIPAGTVMGVLAFSLNSGTATVTSDELNGLLKRLFFETLKTKK